VCENLVVPDCTCLTTVEFHVDATKCKLTSEEYEQEQ
jgi:hypothetical protein